MILGKLQIPQAGSTLKNGLVAYYDMTHSTHFENLVTGSLTQVFNVERFGTVYKIGYSKRMGSGWDMGYTLPIYEYGFRPYDKFSVSFWMYLNSTANNNEIWGIQGYQLGYKIISIWAQGATLYFDLRRGSDYCRVYRASSLALYVWRHIVITYNGYPSSDNINFYVNGVNYTPTVSSNYPVANSSAEYAQVGPGIANYLDEMGVWNRVLNQSEVTQLYNGGAGLAYPNL